MHARFYDVLHFERDDYDKSSRGAVMITVPIMSVIRALTICAAACPGGDTMAANQYQTKAGYAALGLLRQQEPSVLLDATNADGKTVTLQLDRCGDVVWETAC
ncbi:hypothetical protein [Paracoccus sp. (in: a-proteobacteria)]|uniref:hypothetical protein n=1 Tax=Paracoccus sp. TaxID=267 RepID=UPI00396C7B37